MTNSAVAAVGFGLASYGVLVTIGVTSATAWVLAGIIAIVVGEATEKMRKRK
jgi:hypothetical protein